MMGLEINWFMLALIYVVLIPISSIIKKLTINGDDIDTNSYSVVFQLITAFLSIFIIFFEKTQIPTDINTWIAVATTTLIWAIANVIYYIALKNIDVSEVEIISSTRSIWVLLIGFIIFNESITLGKILGVSLIIIGIIIIYWRKGKFNGLDKNHTFILIYAVLISIAAGLDKFVLKSFSVGAYQVIAFLMPAILIMLFVPNTVRDIKPLLKINKRSILIFISSIIFTIGGSCIYFAYKMGAEVSKLGPIMQLTTVITVLLGIFLLNEKENTTKKIIGSIIVCIGAAIINIL